MVVAGPRGLVAGSSRIVFQNGTVLETTMASSGVSVPENPHEIEYIHTNAHFVLVSN